MLAKGHLLGVTLLVLGSAVSSSPTRAQEGPWTLGAIVVEQAWARVVPGGAKTGAIYLTIHNKSADDDYLVAVESPAARSATIHETKQEDGITGMEPIPGGLAMPSHGEVVMRPGSFHIMLTGVSEAMKSGGELPVRLLFREAGALELDVPILPLGAGAPPPKHSGHGS
jgi:copper(I)-binding protein